MSIHLHRQAAAAARLLLASLPLLAGAAVAQSSKPAAPTDPLDARAPVPPLVHRSALSTYRPAGEVQVRSWRDANDTVTRIGGWRAYLREAHAPDATETPGRPEAGAVPAGSAPAASAPAASAPSPSVPAPPSPAPRGHGAHGRH